MQSSLHRFRVVKPAQDSTIQQSPASDKETQRPSNQSGEESKPPRTPVAACQRCRRLKRKCSRTPPECSQCLRAGARCSLTRTSQTPGISSEEAKELQDRIALLTRYVNDLLPAQAPSIEWAQTSTEIVPQTQSPLEVESFNASANSGLDNQYLSLAEINNPAETENTSGTALPDVFTNLTNNSPVAAEQARSVQLNHSPRLGIRIPETAESPGAYRSKSVPKVAAGRQFVDAYFRHIHRAYPFMDREQVLKDVEVMGDFTTEGTEKLSTKLYMIMAIGCTTLRRVGQVSAEISAKFKISYPDIFQECLSNNNIESVETLLLLGLHSLFEPSAISPWIITGNLARLVVSLGLSRQAPQSEQGLSPSQVEMRYRLYWSIYTLDRMVSTSMGLPFGINDENATIPLPSITIGEYASTDRGYYTLVLQLNRHIIGLRQLEEQILQKLHLSNSYSSTSLTQPDKRVIIQHLRASIETWYTQGCLLTPMERDQIPFHNTIPWLNYRYQNLLLLLYTPSHFNSPISSENLRELQRCAQKYIQLSAVLWQQRHLPLNWVTLCRFIALLPILHYCIVRHEEAMSDVREESNLCAEILEAFPTPWHFAQRSAKVFRLLADTTKAMNPPFLPTDFNPDLTARQSHLRVLQDVQIQITELVRDVMGEASVYIRSIDAATDAAKDGSLLQPYRSAEASGGAFSMPWVDTNRLWLTAGDLSMDFI